MFFGVKGSVDCGIGFYFWVRGAKRKKRKRKKEPPHPASPAYPHALADSGQRAPFGVLVSIIQKRKWHVLTKVQTAAHAPSLVRKRSQSAERSGALYNIIEGRVGDYVTAHVTTRTTPGHY